MCKSFLQLLHQLNGKISRIYIGLNIIQSASHNRPVMSLFSKGYKVAQCFDYAPALISRLAFYSLHLWLSLKKPKRLFDFSVVFCSRRCWPRCTVLSGNRECSPSVSGSGSCCRQDRETMAMSEYSCRRSGGLSWALKTSIKRQHYSTAKNCFFSSLLFMMLAQKGGRTVENIYLK